MKKAYLLDMTEDEKETIELSDGVLHKRYKTTEEKTLTDKRKMIKQKVRRAYVRLMGIAYDIKVEEKKSLDSPKTTSTKLFTPTRKLDVPQHIKEQYAHAPNPNRAKHYLDLPMNCVITGPSGSGKTTVEM